MGKVVLVGAGPGDVGLLTVKGVKYIKQADCIVYDRLSSKELLALAKPSCEFVYVGKENHKHVVKQERINEILCEKSVTNRLVVRLKGGDPYVFGRGGEEAIYLKERGVEVEAVPGVSSAVAALADAGIPITHRGVSKGFFVITAHSKKDEEADIDYSLLTDESITCVFLMGLAHVKSIAYNLIKVGRKPDTPTAVISNGTLSNQKKCVGTLCDIAEKIENAGVVSPAIIVVGDVVKFNTTLDFFEKRPLFGKKIAVPRICLDVTMSANAATKHEQSFAEQDLVFSENPLQEKLKELGAEIIDIPVGKIVPIDVPNFFNLIKNSDWVLFTSKNGVKAFFINLHQKFDIRSISHIKFGVVGEQTARELAKYYINADFVADKQTGEGLANEIIGNFTNGQTITICSAKETSGELERGLMEFAQTMQLEINKIDIYENVSLNAAENKTINECDDRVCNVDINKEIGIDISSLDAAVFTSASNAKRFCSMISDSSIEKIGLLRAYSIGGKTTEALKKLGFADIIEADVSSYDAVIETILG